MKLLIDSSTYYLILALIDENKITTFNRYGRNDHSETLVDYLQKFLNANKIDVKKIKEIYIGRGPGSYTGVRICGVVGKVLSYSLNVNLYSFSSLDLLAYAYLDKDKVLPMIDANKDHCFYKTISFKNNLKTEESFIEKQKINLDFNNYYKITMENLINDNKIDTAIKNLMKDNNYQKESNLDYNPNYLREVI